MIDEVDKLSAVAAVERHFGLRGPLSCCTAARAESDVRISLCQLTKPTLTPHSFLSFAASTPHEFIITGGFNIHLDNPADTLTSQFLSLLSSFNLSQHVHFPAHDTKSHS